MSVRRVRNPSRRRRHAARRPNPIRRRRRNPVRIHRRRNPSRRHAFAALAPRRRRNPSRRRRNPDYNSLMEHVAPFAEVGCGMVLGIGANRVLPMTTRKGIRFRGLIHIALAVGVASFAKNRHVTNLAAGFAGAGVLDLFRQNVPTVAKYLQADAVETVLGIEDGGMGEDNPVQADSLGYDEGVNGDGDLMGADTLGSDSLGEEGMYGENDY